MDKRKNNGGHSTKGFAGRKPKTDEKRLIERLDNIIDNEDELIFSSSQNVKIFEIISPVNPSYRTYSQLR